MRPEEQKRWDKAFDEWKNVHFAVEELYKRIAKQRDRGIAYVMTTRDMQLIRRHVEAYKILMILAGSPM